MDLFLITTKLKNHFPVVREQVEPHPERAAVLVILYQKQNQTYVLMTKRAFHLKIHAGEIAFPGGVVELEDDDLLCTAVRETQEEIGVEVEPSRVMGCLTKVKTRTGIEITPFVAALTSPPKINPSDDEVYEVLEMPLAPLLSTQQRDIGFKASEEMVLYWYKHHRIWGASAKILQQIENLNFI
ncbi:MAG: putative Nudix hydrolase NudL [Nitrospinaceae bacterium]|nr:MAG: putative Nudix hydrolase NudL [Nitrospinaceae bacterium]